MSSASRGQTIASVIVMLLLLIQAQALVGSKFKFAAPALRPANTEQWAQRVHGTDDSSAAGAQHRITKRSALVAEQPKQQQRATSDEQLEQRTSGAHATSSSQQQQQPHTLAPPEHNGSKLGDKRATFDLRFAQFIKSHLLPFSERAESVANNEELANELGKLFRVVSVTNKMAKFIGTPKVPAESEAYGDSGELTIGRRRPDSDDGNADLARLYSANSDDDGDKNKSAISSRSDGDISGEAAKSQSRASNRAVLGRLAKKTDWNALFVKLAKVFLQYFLDLILNDMFGTTGK